MTQQEHTVWVWIGAVLAVACVVGFVAWLIVLEGQVAERVIQQGPQGAAPVPPARVSRDTADELLRDRQLTAWVNAVEFVTRKLKTPSTADFGGRFFNGGKAEDHVHSLGNNEYLVTGWLDAQNIFGATVRYEFTVMLRDNKDGTWNSKPFRLSTR